MSAITTMARAAAVVLVAACAFATRAHADDGGPDVPLDESPAPALAGTSWRFVEIMGEAPPASVEATLELSGDGAATGVSGCNHFVGRYVSAGADLSFPGMASTKMWCQPEVMTVEMAVQTALNRTRHVAAAPGELDLLASDGTVLARLIPATPPLSPVAEPVEP